MQRKFPAHCFGLCRADPLVSKYSWASKLPQASELLRQANEFDVTFATLEAFLADDRWVFPSDCRTKGKQLHRIFSTWR